MKTVTKLEIPPSFDATIVSLVRKIVAGAGLDYEKVTMSDMSPLIIHLKAELKIAHSIGIEYGLIKAVAELKKELDADKEEKNDE